MDIANKSSSKWLELKRSLVNVSGQYLRTTIHELYILSKTNQDFLEARFIKNGESLDRYKDIIKANIAPNEPWKSSQKINIVRAKKAFSAYKKATADIIGTIDLMICYVEYGTDFLCRFGDMYEQYYDSLESVFDHALNLMKTFEHNEVSLFIQRLSLVVSKAQDMGYGYYDTISDMFESAYPNSVNI